MRKSLLFIGLLFSSFYFISCSYRNPVKVGENLVVVADKDATEEEAKLLGEFLISHGLIETNEEKTVYLKRENELITVGFPVDRDELHKNPQMEQKYSLIQLMLKERLYGGRSVRVMMTDNNFTELRTATEINPGPSTNNPEMRGMNSDSMLYNLDNSPAGPAIGPGTGQGVNEKYQPKGSTPQNQQQQRNQ